MKNSELPVHPIPKNRHLSEAAKNGITKREYFAVKVVQGLCSKDSAPKGLNKAGDIVNFAIGVADLLIEELEKETK